MGKKSEPGTLAPGTQTLPEPAQLIEFYRREREAFLGKKWNDAQVAWIETGNPYRVVEALDFPDRGSSRRGARQVILPTYCHLLRAIPRRLTPARALLAIAKAFHFSSPTACRKTLLRWRRQVREERRQLEERAKSGDEGDLATLGEHRAAWEVDFPIPSPAALEPRADTRIRRA